MSGLRSPSSCSSKKTGTCFSIDPTPVTFTATTLDGQTAFLSHRIDRGSVPDAARFRRGSVFSLVGDGAPLGTFLQDGRAVASRSRACLNLLTAFLRALPHVTAALLIAEPVCGWPGIGRTLVEAARVEDVPLERAAFMALALAGTVGVGLGAVLARGGRRGAAPAKRTVAAP